MNARDKEIFRHGFMAALALADGYARELQERGMHRFAGIVQAHMVNAEKCFDDILVKVLDRAETSAEMLEAVKAVIEEEWA